MKTYHIPINWQSYKRFTVAAENLQEAVAKAMLQFFSEPDENYLEDSFEIDSIIGEEHPDETIDYLKIYK